MLKKLPHAGFRQWWLGRLCFYPGRSNNRRSASYTKEEYTRLEYIQNERPVCVMSDSSTKYWWFQSEFYSETDNLTEEQIVALITEKREMKRRRIEKAVSFSTISNQSQYSDASAEDGRDIPREVKIYVWQRDKGRCVVCSSNKKLEFDHIIPISLGGNNTERNIQLLCENCNRRKGANVGFGKHSRTTSQTHAIITCRNCLQKLRLPKGKGELKVSCPKCYAQFTIYT